MTNTLLQNIVYLFLRKERKFTKTRLQDFTCLQFLVIYKEEIVVEMHADM